jgi:hypothetical protein
MKKISFDIDWDSLFPGKVFKVEKMVHHVKPLTIKGIASISQKIKGVLPVLKESGIDVENLENLEEKNVIEVMVKAIPILMETAPEIISDATGIEVDSLMCFPPQYLIELVTVAVQANMESKEALEKNFSCLMGMFRKKKEIQDSNAD